MKLSQCLEQRAACAAATQGKLVASGNWTSGGGVANAVDERLRGAAAAAAPTRLYFCAATTAAKYLWQARVATALQLKTAPTAAQIQELHFAMDTLRDGSVMVEPLSNDDLVELALALDLGESNDQPAEDGVRADDDADQQQHDGLALVVEMNDSSSGDEYEPADDGKANAKLPLQRNKLVVAAFVAHIVKTSTAATGSHAARTQATPDPTRLCALVQTIEQLLFVWALLGGVASGTQHPISHPFAATHVGRTPMLATYGIKRTPRSHCRPSMS